MARISAVNFAVVVLGLLAMVDYSTQFSLRNPLLANTERTVDGFGEVNEALGIVLTSDSNEKALNQSRLFVRDSSNPFIDINGRRYHLGRMNGAEAVYVKTGGGSINTALAVQTLLSTFKISGIVLMGSAGSTNDSVPVGSVSIPRKVAYIGSTTWQQFKSKGELKFGDYNYEKPGENHLGSLVYNRINLYTSEGVSEVFYIYVNQAWLKLANELEDLPLLRCGVTSNCLSAKPSVVVGLRGVTSDVYVDNKAYRSFIKTHFKAATVDTDSAVVAVAAKSNGKPFIVIRGVSNLAGGGPSEPNAGALASTNAVSTLGKFVSLLRKKTSDF